jgi:hypothetical protein
LDEININLVPILLKNGVRLFANLGEEPLELENMQVIETPGVTHLRFCVVS